MNITAAQLFGDALPSGAASLPGKQNPQEQPQGQTDHFDREYPLPHRNPKHSKVAEMNRGVGHPSMATRRTHDQILTRSGDEQFGDAVGTADTGEAMTKESAAQVATELVLDEGWEVAVGVVLGSVGEERGQLLADSPVQNRPLGFTALVARPQLPRSGTIPATIAHLNRVLGKLGTPR